MNARKPAIVLTRKLSAATIRARIRSAASWYGCWTVRTYR